MERIPTQVGDVIWTDFPYSDSRESKFRPALVLAKVAHAELVVCKITSVKRRSKFPVKIAANDCQRGNLNPSYVRVDTIFTINKIMVKKNSAKLNSAALRKVSHALSNLFKDLPD